MITSKNNTANSHAKRHGFDTLEHGIYTEVLTPDNSIEPLSEWEKSLLDNQQNGRILILANVDEPIPSTNKSNKRSFKTVTTKEHYDYDNYRFDINSRKSGSYTQILKSLITQTLAMQEMYKRVLFMRFDLYLGRYTPDNKLVTTFLKRLRKRLIHRYGVTKFGYLWAREESKSKNQHYHFVFIMDGNIVRYPSNIHDQIRHIWTDMGGSFHFAKHHYIDSDKKLREAILHGSYLAKVRSKGNRPDQTKDYNASRLKIKKVG